MPRSKALELAGIPELFTKKNDFIPLELQVFINLEKRDKFKYTFLSQH